MPPGNFSQPISSKPAVTSICSQNLERDIERVKADVDQIIGKDEQNYELFITAYLNSTGTYQKESNETQTSGFKRILEKIKHFFKFGKGNEADCSIIKREIQNDLYSDFPAEESDESNFDYLNLNQNFQPNYNEESAESQFVDDSKKSPVKISVSDVDYLKKIIDCFKNDENHRMNVAGDKISLTKNKDSTKICIILKKNFEENQKKDTETTENELQQKNPVPIMKEGRLEDCNNSSSETEADRIEKRVRYLAHLHHDVSMEGGDQDEQLVSVRFTKVQTAFCTLFVPI